ncbi:twin-arginine translocation pathway signal protein [Acidovorax carolinensis]|uniref:Twin-arginine translocation pathway signal protein n=1 Tax=Acidovorax carolinensis TaxID=553814 RepID=A0A240U755_9BURK|nr:twin-arginine translocation pathway signal protein [Acidovorax carolinensis]
MHFSDCSAISLNRRHWIQWTAAASAVTAGRVMAQPLPASAPRNADGERPLVVAQVVDLTAGQQDISRDFLAGSRSAWQDLNARGGVRGRTVQHVTIETDGTLAGLKAAWQAVHGQAGCVALSGCVGNGAAAGLVALQSAARSASPLALVAPWLHNAVTDSEAETVFEVFPDHQIQIAHAIKTHASLGVKQIGVVFATAQVQQQSQVHVLQAAKSLGLQAQILPLAGTQGPAATQLTNPTQTIILFVGGTPELHAFASKLVAPPGRQCFVVALADVNLQVLAQMGGTPKGTSIIATQAVPLVTSSLPVVRAYRDALSRFFDEAPSPQGLAGFIAARYTAEILSGISGPVTRASALSALQRRADVNVGGYIVAYQGKKRSNAYVTQSMLTQDGRIIG